MDCLTGISSHNNGETENTFDTLALSISVAILL